MEEGCEREEEEAFNTPVEVSSGGGTTESSGSSSGGHMMFVVVVVVVVFVVLLLRACLLFRPYRSSFRKLTSGTNGTYPRKGKGQSKTNRQPVSQPSYTSHDAHAGKKVRSSVPQALTSSSCGSLLL